MSTVKKLKLIEFFDGLYFATIITSLFAVFHGISLSQIVFAQGLYSLNVLLMEVPTGVIADKFGRKVSMALGYSMSIIGIALFVIEPSVIVMYLMRFLQSTGSALVSGANEALLFEGSKDEGLNYKQQSSIANSNAIIGLCAAGVLGGVFYQIYDNASLAPLMLATVATQLVAVVLALSIKEPRAEKSIAKEEAKAFAMLAETVRLLKTNKKIFALTMFGMLAACNEYFLYQTYGPYFKEIGVSNFWIGAVFTLGLLLSFVLVRNIWKIERYLTMEKALALIKFIAAFGYIGLALVTQDTLLIIILISTIGVFNIERPIVSDFANQEIDNRIRATVLSGMSLISRITKAGLTFIIGFIIAEQSITTGYLISGVYMIVGTCIGYWLLVRCGCITQLHHKEVSKPQPGVSIQ